ncbi:MAG: hypothetical protein R2807_10540 [Chitinophagales bacterium]
MNYFYKTLYTRDQPLFEVKVILLFLFSLFFGSNILIQFKSASSVAGVVILLFLPFILIISGIYYYYKIFQLKEVNPIDIIIFLSLLLPIYNAVTMYFIFDMKLMKAFYAVTGRFYVVMCSLLYYYIRADKITLKQYAYSNLVLCWFCFGVYTFVSLTIPPQTFMGGLEDGLVGYNPSKGGYLYRFSSAFLTFGMIYYFLKFVLKDSFVGLILWMVLMAYQVFIDKGRIELVSEAVPMFLYMFVILKWPQFFKKLFIIFIIICIALLIAYLIDPKILTFTADMYWMFIKFFLGQKTGEGSADMRWTEMADVYYYLMKHPSYIFFGIGTPKKEILQLNVGNVVFGDIGIVGGLLSQGIVGLIFVYSVFLYPIFIWFNVKHYRKDLLFNVGILSTGTIFIQSLFNGAIFYSFLGIMPSLIILECYRVKEKVYWKKVRSQLNTHAQKT